MKNKPDPALLRPSNLSNEIKKRVLKSRKTIPLKENLILINIKSLVENHISCLRIRKNQIGVSHISLEGTRNQLTCYLSYLGPWKPPALWHTSYIQMATADHVKCYQRYSYSIALSSLGIG
jgi:hypothetical protein